MTPKYDIFISFKATEKGEVTSDVAVATELYHALTGLGFRVFFSSETVTKGGSSDFSRAIDNALDSARLLIVVASKNAYITSRWVEYEWKTFNADILSNIKSDAQIITYTDGVETVKLPRILRYVQNFGFGEKEKLLTFVKSFFSREEGGLPEPAGFVPESGSGLSADEHNLYNSAGKGEFEILRLRAGRSYAMDIRAIDTVKSRSRRGKYNVLVLGCAYGFVAETRFGLDDDMDHVICVDKNPEVLRTAKELYKQYSHMHFCQADVQSEEFVPTMKEIFASLGIEGVDLIFTSDLLRYLNVPQLTVRRCRKLLGPGGMLVIRDSDDSQKLACPDPEGLLKKITDNSYKAPGMPNYHIGRELPQLIRNGGFEICEILIDIHSTANLKYEEKEAFFLSTFGSRKNIALQVMERETVPRPDLKQIVECVDKLEEIYFNSDFWYSESNMVFIAAKN